MAMNAIVGSIAAIVDGGGGESKGVSLCTWIAIPN
jgi:hypothetical protein